MGTNVTELGLGFLEYGNVHLKHVKMCWQTADGNHYISPRAWRKVAWWLNFNSCNRCVIYDPTATRDDWMTALIKSSQCNVVDFPYELLLAKPDRCIRLRSTVSP
jgi:hypothetical protein